MQLGALENSFFDALRNDLGLTCLLPHFLFTCLLLLVLLLLLVQQAWSENEECTLVATHKVIGNKWSDIAKRLVCLRRARRGLGGVGSAGGHRKKAISNCWADVAKQRSVFWDDLVYQ